MQKLNLVIVFNPEKTKVLMCFRTKDPYQGLYNFIGGKIEDGEDSLESAYRELEEETGIKRQLITLRPFIDFHWHHLEMMMLVYIGRLKQDVTLIQEIHPLQWMDIHEDFFDMTRFAGEGNIGHMMEIYFQRPNITED